MFPFETKILSDNSNNNILNISKSGIIELENRTAGDITVINTYTSPFLSRISDHRLSIISYDHMLTDGQR